MKKTICVVLVALSAFLLAKSSSYALDNKTEEIVLANVFIEANNNPGEKPVPEKKVEPLYSIDYNYIVSEQPVLYKDGKETGTVVHRGEPDVPFSSYITRHKIHQPIVYKSSFVSTYKKTTKPFKSSALDLEFSSILNGVTDGGVVEVGTAFMTNLVLHEFGHVVMANYVGATGSSFNFFQEQNGTFFLGISTVEQIDDNSRLPYSMGGELAVDLVFEHALQNYREKPTLYNKSLLFFSGLDFLWYSLYAFYLSDGHPYYDPIVISKETGISGDMLFSIVLAKSMINVYRVYSGQDRVIPYFTAGKKSAFLNISIIF